MKQFLLALLVAAFPLVAQAQVPGSGVSSFGIITPGDCASWKASGVVMDSGAPCGGGGGIPAPGPSTLGGLFSHSVVSHLFLTGIGLDGTVSAAQPAVADISGLGTAATQNIGTGGATVPLLSTVNTWDLANAFTTSVIAGSASNGITITQAAITRNNAAGTMSVVAGTCGTCEILLSAGGFIQAQAPIIQPTTNNTTSLGTAALGWSNVFSVLGTFGTSVTAGTSSNGITIGASTINRNTAAGSLAINAGIGTSTVLGLTAGGSVTITAPATSVSGALSLQNLTTQGTVCNSAAGLVSTSAGACPGAPAMGLVLAGVLKGVNMNTTADQAITLTGLPGKWSPFRIYAVNPTGSVTAAVGGIYTAASKGGFAIALASNAYTSLTSATPDTANNAFSLSLASWQYDATTLFFSLTTPSGATGTVDLYVYAFPMP